MIHLRVRYSALLNCKKTPPGLIPPASTLPPAARRRSVLTTVCEVFEEDGLECDFEDVCDYTPESSDEGWVCEDLHDECRNDEACLACMEPETGETEESIDCSATEELTTCAIAEEHYLCLLGENYVESCCTNEKLLAFLSE